MYKSRCNDRCTGLRPGPPEPQRCIFIFDGEEQDMHYVIFYPDEMRAKSLGCYGNQTVSTPNFDRLAAEGVVFENNYTQHPVCVASRCAMMTGWYPHVAGYRTLLHYIEPYQPNFLRYIKQAGYQIHMYGKNHVFSEETFAECVDYHSNPKFGSIGSGLKGEALEALMKVLSCEDYTMLKEALPDSELERINDTVCVNMAVDAIRNYRDGDKPLFIFVPIFNPHAPYYATEHFHNLYSPDDMPEPLPADLPGKPSAYRLIRKYRGLEHADPKLFKRITAIYQGMCSYCDMLFGRILDALDDTGLADDTTVILSSDHGDWAGDYGLVEKWPNAFDDCLTKVPLVVRAPGCKKGHRVSELSETFDIFPTICELEGIPIRHSQFGRPFTAQLRGERGDPGRVAYCEGGYDTWEPHAFEGYLEGGNFEVTKNEGNIYYPKVAQQRLDPESVCRGLMMRDSRYKCVVRTNGENELYDMEADPDELDNLYGMPEYAETAAKFEKRMLTWLIGTSDVVPWERHR